MSIVPSLIEYCSPTLASLKVGSLFGFIPEDWNAFEREAEALRRELAPKGLAMQLVRTSETRVLCYLYRPAQLSLILSQADTAAFLRKNGYRFTDLPSALQTLCLRLSMGGDFPHEIGVFLGYPLADVIGFIENHGKNCLCTGCWKAYSDECGARRQFSRFERCTRIYKRLYGRGRTLSQLTVAA